MGVGLANALVIESKRGFGAEPPALGYFWDLLNNPIFGTFQLKFYLKSSETCLLLYVSSLPKCNILAIILFKY